MVGSNLRSEAPILAHRLRKAALAGASVNLASSTEYEFFFDVANYASGAGLIELLSGIAKATDGKGGSKSDKAIVASLKDADDALVLLGLVAGRHAASSQVRALAAKIANKTGAKLGFLTEGANSAGASLAGVLPHRGSAGKNRKEQGLDVAGMLDASLDALVLVNVEPNADISATTDIAAKLANQKFVIALTPFVTDELLESADLLLPVGTVAESSGTFVNVTGTWQSFAGIANPVGEARPCWKVLRVLGNLTDADGFDYVTSEDVLTECRSALESVDAGTYSGDSSGGNANGSDAPDDEIDTPIYSVDAMVRRANALQRTPAAQRAAPRGDG